MTQVRQMFDRISPRYDLLNALLSFGLDSYWRRRAVQALALRPGERVVDLCCGTGALSADLYRAVRPAGEVVGVDFSLNMLFRARRAHPVITFLEGDACAVPLPEGSFQAATLAYGPRNIPDLPALWKEMLRLVEPGGRIAVLELTRPRGILGWGHKFYLSVILPFLGGLISGDRAAYSYLSRTIDRFIEPEELLAGMREAGMVEVRAHRLTGGIVTLHLGRRPVTGP